MREDNFEEEELYTEYLYFEYKDKWESSKKQLKEQADEIKRLNNIINELERKMLNDKLYIEDISKKQPYPIEEFRIRNPYTTGSYDTCVKYLEKIKELKGEVGGR